LENSKKGLNLSLLFSAAAHVFLLAAFAGGGDLSFSSGEERENNVKTTQKSKHKPLQVTLLTPEYNGKSVKAPSAAIAPQPENYSGQEIRDFIMEFGTWDMVQEELALENQCPMPGNNNKTKPIVIKPS